MSDIDELVRETFESQAGGVQVPPFDGPAFRRRVAEGRRRRRLRVSAGVAVAASVAAVAVYAVPAVLDATQDGGGTSQVAVAPVPVDASVLPEPLYFTAGMRLIAVTPDGEVHDLGRFESVVGSTAEGVLAVDTDSQLVWVGASSSHEGDGAFTFERGAGATRIPQVGPVQSAALSGDGRYLAWITLDDALQVYDLKAERRISSTDVGADAYVTSVSDRGALLSVDGRLQLFQDDGVVDVPITGDGYGWLSDLAGDYVSVADGDGVTRIYDVTNGGPDASAGLVDSVPGTGRLAPYAKAVVTVSDADEPTAVARLWADGSGHRLSGLAGRLQSAGWLDEDYAVVTSWDSAGTSVYVCPVADLSCTRVAFSQDEVRLAE